ncbi:hypothetical protein Q9R20_06415 [Microbacterium sp. PRF11]|uniref:hypothetical protein n=1 Tax=Microbacterium sp. PRF11 TaxID=2962593 RepID=UPI002882A628|nr:hypothetical protein [Microbacterium sp. PRF11]MDT0116621.1 hypothetical protein [Microbacterium sp. PRF11]
MSDVEWARHIGKSLSTTEICRELDLDPIGLEVAVRWLRVLRVVTDDGRHIYPAWQINRGAVVHGLRPVLETLRTGADDPWSWALWLHSDVRDDDGGDGRRRQIDDLAAGDVAGVLRRATRVATDWAD